MLNPNQRIRLNQEAKDDTDVCSSEIARDCLVGMLTGEYGTYGSGIGYYTYWLPKNRMEQFHEKWLENF